VSRVASPAPLLKVASPAAPLLKVASPAPLLVRVASPAPPNHPVAVSVTSEASLEAAQLGKCQVKT
jgi:hypothetical protein